MYMDFSRLRELHLEISNRCNASCPMCDRNYFGGRQLESMNLQDWTAEDAHKVFHHRMNRLRNILFCGTHGDPAACRDALQIVQSARQTGASIEFYSNGGLRSADWWRELGGLLNRQHWTDSHYRRTDLGIFSIDGLADTNHIYRRGVEFEKLIENARAFISAGGLARWDFIVFRHNQHQVDQARELARSLGFVQFRLRKTARFNYSPLGPGQWPIMSKDGQLEGTLEPPDIPEFRNEEVEKFESLRTEQGLDAYFNSTKINCLYSRGFQRLYVNHSLRVFPCCYLANDIVRRDASTFFPAQKSRLPAIREDSRQKVFSRWEENFNSLKVKAWDEILEHPWFAEELEKSWESDLSGGRLKRCARTCGEGYRPITSQSLDSPLSSGPSVGPSQS